MTEKKFKVVHYINQFHGGIGGEEKANNCPNDVPPLYYPVFKEGPVGPGEHLLKKMFGDAAGITATVICGDNYFNENLEEATQKIMDFVKQKNPDIFIAGPAFNAGRYGLACGAICKAVSENLNIPVLSGMYPENPGAEMYKKSVYVIKTKNSAAGMQEAATLMVKLALKLLAGEELKSPEEESYIPRGIRKNYFSETTGAERAVEMLVKKLKGEEFKTEYPMPIFDRVTPLPPIEDLSKITIGLVTSGGIVPKGNPDHIESSSASKFGKYSLEGLMALSKETHQTAHGGYDPTYANEDPNRVLPLDAMRELEQQGIIGKLHNFYYATVGNGTSIANARKYAQAIAKDLKEAGVQAVILTST